MATRYWVGGSGIWDSTSTTHWSTTSGGAGGASAPTNVDTVILDTSSGTGTCTTDATATGITLTLNSSTLVLSLGNNLTLGGNFTLTLGTLALNTYIFTCFIFTANNSNIRSIAFGTGKIILTANSNTIWSMQNAENFSYTGISNVECNYSGSIGTRTINHNTGGTITNQEGKALNFKITAGTDIITTSVVSAGTTFKNLDFTGFSGTLANIGRTIYGNLTYSSTMTLTAGSGTCTLAATSGTQLITTALLTIDFPLTFNGIGGTWTFQDALTQGATRAFTIINGTVNLKANTVNTVESFVTTGTNKRYLYSSIFGTAATITQATGTVNAAYLTIKDIIATGGAKWNALWSNNNIDAGGNIGWFFGDLPVITSTEIIYNLRSFTQPRRF